MRLTQLAVKNYRTLEDVTLKFESNYTALCGQNDSGKSNITRAIKVLVGAPKEEIFMEERMTISWSDDFPRWAEEKGASPISIEGFFELDSAHDQGIIEFLGKQLALDGPPSNISIALSISVAGPKQVPVLRVNCNGKVHEGSDAEEVFRRFRSSSSLIFHNSTQPPLPWDLTRFQGALRELTPESREVLDDLRRTSASKMKKIAKLQAEKIEGLLSSLGSDLKVSLTIGGGEWTHLPYIIRLGDKKVDVDLQAWGSGTKNRTQILLALFRAHQVSQTVKGANKLTPVVIIEEPESFLHPGGQASFGRAIQELATKFDVQVIVTTHSPYMLSRNAPKSNLLLRRRLNRGNLRNTEPVLAEGANWMLPYAETLGLDSTAFESWKGFFVTAQEDVLLVEGVSDKAYFEDLRNPEKHGANALQWKGDITPYDGSSNLKAGIFLRFLKQRSRRLIVTVDLDAKVQCGKHLEELGFKEGHDLFYIGTKQPGLDSIEGLVPAAIRGVIYKDHPDKVAALASGTEARNKARKEIKELLQKEFLNKATAGTDDYKEFYKMAKAINRANKEAAAEEEAKEEVVAAVDVLAKAAAEPTAPTVMASPDKPA